MILKTKFWQFGFVLRSHRCQLYEVVIFLKYFFSIIRCPVYGLYFIVEKYCQNNDNQKKKLLKVIAIIS